MYQIYLLTNNCNSKQYVGFTNNLHRRLIQHKSAAVSGPKFLIHKAIRKYGWENFSWEVLYSGGDRQSTLDMEQKLIIDYKTFGKGYNLTAGGEGQIERKISEKTRKKMRKNHADVKGKNNPFYGKKHTPETLELLRKLKTGKTNPGHKWTKKEKMEIKNRMKGNSNHSKHYILEFNGKKEDIFNLAKYCREHNMNYRSILANMSAGNKSYKNMTIYKVVN